MAKDYLVHYGILGQKWGVRRFQNEDGTLTAAGKERYGSEDTPWSGKSSEEAKRLAQQRDLDRARYEALIYKDRYGDNDDEGHTKLSRKDITRKVLDARNDVRKVAREHWKELLVGGAIAAALIQKFKGKKASTITSSTSSFYPNMAGAKDIVWNKRFEPAGLLGAGKYPNMAGMREAVPIWTKRPANAAGLLTAPDRNSTASILKRVTHKIVGHDGMEGGITTDYVLHCNRSSDELYHYGIKGQKWGIRNEKKNELTSIKKQHEFTDGGDENTNNANEKNLTDSQRKAMETVTKSIHDTLVKYFKHEFDTNADEIDVYVNGKGFTEEEAAKSVDRMYGDITKNDFLTAASYLKAYLDVFGTTTIKSFEEMYNDPNDPNGQAMRGQELAQKKRLEKRAAEKEQKDKEYIRKMREYVRSLDIRKREPYGGLTTQRNDKKLSKDLTRDRR